MSHDPISVVGNTLLQIGVVSTATVPAGTANLTDVDGKLHLTAADLGSVLFLIMTGGSMLRTTVLSVTDSTHCVLADNAPLDSDANSNCTLFRARGLILTGSLTINTTLTAHDTMSFSFLDNLAAPLCRQPVLFTFQGDHLFGGTIDNVKASNLPGTNQLMQWDCDCTGWDKVIYKRTTGEPTVSSGSPAVENPSAGVFSGMTIDAIMQFLITNALGDEGLELVAITGPVVPSFSVSYAACGDAFDQLVVSDPSTVLHWYIDPLKVIHLEAPGTVAAPWNISDSDPSSFQAQITVTWDRSQYINRVIVRLNKEVSDPVTETFVGDGHTTTFQLKNGAAGTPAITENGTPVSVGVNGVNTGCAWYWNLGSTSITQDPAGAPLTSATTLQIVVPEFITGYAQAENSTSLLESEELESGTGLYEMVQQQDNPATQTDGDTLAAALAALYGVIPKRLEFTTYRPGLKIGQEISVTLAQLGISSNFTIDSVTVTAPDNLMMWQVTAVGSPLINWDYRATLATLRPSGSGSGAGGGGGAISTPPAQVYWRTLLIKDSKLGNNIADNLTVQGSGPGRRVAVVLRKHITADYVVRINKGSGTSFIVVATVTIPSSTPIEQEIQVLIPAIKFVDGEILTFDILASDGAKDADGIAALTVEWGVLNAVTLFGDWKGIWNSSAIYKQNDTVEFGGSSWISLQDTNQNHEPDLTTGTWWDLVAQKGDTGPAATLPLTTKGDLLTYGPAGSPATNQPVRLGVGTDGDVLTADSTTTDGIKWAPPGTGISAVFGICIDGGGSVVPTGVRGYLQLPYACTITGWSILADQSGSISVDVDAHSSSAPPTAPTLPNTTSDKISASAPIALSSAQTAAVGTSGVSTWTTGRAQWDVVGFNVTSASTLTRVMIEVFATRD